VENGFLLFFGPKKLPFKLDENGMVENASTMPFHGIISRGLLEEVKAGKINGELWYRNAPFIGQINAEKDNSLVEFHSIIKKCKVLSFGQSALTARKYLEQHYQSEGKDDDLEIEIWNIKEGHTSSVWKIEVNQTTGKETFIINVARDIEASKELKETSERLKILSTTFPDLNIAKVLDISSVKDELLPFEVTVTRNEWIDNSFEIHKRNMSAGSEELLLVERFITSPENPSKITSVVGRIFSQQESEEINNDINKFLTTAATCQVEKPSLNINEGDVVWDGEKAIIVAVS
jgi:hypothetical protein